MPTTVPLQTVPRSLASARCGNAQPLAPSLLDGLNRILMLGVETLELWGSRRCQRRELQALSDHLLHDIGRSRTDAEAEASKPFWRA